VREAQTGVLVSALVEGQLDAVLIARPARDPRMVAVDLFEDRFLLAAHGRRLARLGVVRPALHPEDLDPEQLLLLDEGHCLADQALAVCGLDRRFLKIDLGATSLTTLCRLVAADHGLTLLPEIAAEAELGASPDLAIRRFAPPEPGRQLALVRRAGTDGAGWFPALAGLLTETGTRLVARARDLVTA
jgi:LysR family hydrogen peroxide-inducible transcriptional activator